MKKKEVTDLTDVMLGQDCERLYTSEKEEIRERRVEVGRFVKLKAIHVICYHESFPTWLLLLDALESLSITICGVDSMETFEEKCEKTDPCSIQFIRWVIDQIGKDKFRFASIVDHIKENQSLVLISGSDSFVALWLKSHASSQKAVFVIDKHFGGRIRRGKPPGELANIPNAEWLRLQHSSFGGPTNYVALVGAVGLNISPLLSTLRRSIRDIFSSNIKPTSVKGGDLDYFLSNSTRMVEEKNFYTLTDTLRCNLLWLPVYHPTHFATSGWGKRVLSTPEVSAAYGYPRHVHQHLEQWIFEYAPVQILIPLF